MNLDELKNTSGEWLRGSGPEGDIVISSRIRLARNLADFPFSPRLSSHEKTEIQRIVRERLGQCPFGQEMAYFDVEHMGEVDRQFLVERQLISREHASGEGSRGVAIGPRECLAVMINEEDHLRIQVMHSGYALRDVWEELNRVDDALEQCLHYAFSAELGYLTACPTNVGTGIRVSVMLHLPALVLTKQIEKVFRALSKINLAVRGLYGEGTQASGDFYQISNQITLGKSEEQIIEELTAVVPNIIEYERKGREALVTENRESLHDRMSRARGILRTAQQISSEETMHLLSSVRMGINLGLIDDLPIATVNELFIHTQPAHLQKLHGQELPTQQRNVARAAYLRQRLAN